MFGSGVHGFLGRGTDLFALLVFRALHLELRVEFGPRFGLGSVLLGGLLGGAGLGGLLATHGVLHGRCLGVHRGSLLRAFHPGCSRFGTGLLRLGVCNGLDAVGLFASRAWVCSSCPSAVNESLPA